MTESKQKVSTVPVMWRVLVLTVCLLNLKVLWIDGNEFLPVAV